METNAQPNNEIRDNEVQEEVKEIKAPQVGETPDAVIEEPGGELTAYQSDAALDKEPQENPYVKSVLEFLANLFGYLAQFFSEYREIIVNLALILAALITVRVTVAILAAINDIPLVAPTFELIGILFTGWFAWTYLRQAESRKEIGQRFQNLKEEIFGKDS